MQIFSVNKNTSKDILLQIESLIKDNWGDEYNNAKEIESELFLARNDIGLPNIYYILEGKEVIATISLLENDIEGHSRHFPWLANLFVKEKHRLKGMGSKLCSKVLNDAKELGYNEVYLYTFDVTDFYTQRDWVIIEEFTYKKLDYKLLKISV
jgi:N-acetylglutamate synthase-like GNAT family acetyltransferase